MNRIYKAIPEIYRPICVIIALQIIVHSFLGFYTYGDDVLMQEMLKNEDLLSFTLDWYNTWSSRVIINGIVVLLASVNVMAWKVLDIFFIVLIPYSLVELTGSKYKTELWVLSGSLFFLYPFTHQNSAGWVTTTISYLWPVSLALYGFLVLKREITTEKVKISMLVLGVLAQIVACNAEQMAVVYSVVTFVVFVYVCSHKKPKVFPALMFLISVLSIVFHLTCPGNAARNIAAIKLCDADFEMLTLIEKLQLGFGETMSLFLYAPNMIYLALCILLCIVIWMKRSDWGSRIAAAIPLLVVIGVGFTNIVPEVSIFHPMSVDGYFSTEVYGGLVNITNFNFLSSYLPMAVMIICMSMNIIAIFISIDNIYISLLSVVIYCCSIGSGMIMGFSPTLYASSSRPYTISFFALIAIIMFVYSNNREYLKDTFAKKSITVVAGMAGVYFVSQLINIVMLYENYVKI